MKKHYTIATRGSSLALWQANHVKAQLEDLGDGLTVSLIIVRTKGDIIQDVPLSQVGGKGLFVKEIEEALLDGRADLAVHSIKDVPMVFPEGLILGCVPQREVFTDCFLSCRYPSIDALPEGAHVGTSSLRRQAQLLSRRPDLSVSSLRGNVDTRLRKLKEGLYDGIILASAGLKRLGLSAPHMQHIAPEVLLPAIGQGALGLECREDDYDLLVRLADLEDRSSRVCVNAERALLAGLDGGCQVPIAGHADLIDEETLVLKGLVAEVDGSNMFISEKRGDASLAEKIGGELASELLDMGGRAILEKLYKQR